MAREMGDVRVANMVMLGALNGTLKLVKSEDILRALGESLKGHEFHYSKAVLHPSDDTRTVFEVLRGEGIDGQKDGLCRKNLLATYTHIHAGGNPEWARCLLRVAMKNNFSLRFKKKG
jgi:cobyrinic acid a,c-diamide synthase